MRYVSTRGGLAPLRFSETILMGLAPDGGLAMPEQYPQISETELARWEALSYEDLAFEVMSRFIDDIAPEQLKSLIDKTYIESVFHSQEIAPLRFLSDGTGILALSNGPTLAFKDMAMQFLGNLFEYTLEQRNQQLTILGATSGDTGSAAEYAMRGKKRIKVFMLSPAGKMSPFQRAQMYSLQDENIHNIAIQGMFDDCQDIVKAVQNDADFKAKYQISTVNSINWARIVAQVVYYFKGYFAAKRLGHTKISFAVPSGNFGNVCAGHIARQMGLPIHRLIVATNENDVLDEFFKTGIYRPRTSKETHITSSPSMDISKASNFERFIFDLLERDAEKIKQLWADVDSGKGFDLSHDLARIRDKFGFVSGASSHQDRLEMIRQIDQTDDEIIDPHTADGLKVAREIREVGETVICLETALPIKFEATIQEALQRAPMRPADFEGIENLPQRVIEMSISAELVKTFIQQY